jgi:hypothetical protein
MTPRFRLVSIAMLVAALAGCKSTGDIVVDSGVGITAVRSPCPAVGIPDHTGNITLFSPADSTLASAIDIEANMTNVRTQCDDTGAKVYTLATFDIEAQRSNTKGARQVRLPYFVTVLRGGNAVVAKRIGEVTLNFADGQARAQAVGKAQSYIDKAEATLPAEIREKITRKRKAGDADAAIDPLSLPDVKAALARADFEMLLGFQLTNEQLTYNATR